MPYHTKIWLSGKFLFCLCYCSLSNSWQVVLVVSCPHHCGVSTIRNSQPAGPNHTQYNIVSSHLDASVSGSCCVICDLSMLQIRILEKRYIDESRKLSAISGGADNYSTYRNKPASSSATPSPINKNNIIERRKSSTSSHNPQSHVTVSLQSQVRWYV